MFADLGSGLEESVWSVLIKSAECELSPVGPKIQNESGKYVLEYITSR